MTFREWLAVPVWMLAELCEWFGEWSSDKLGDLSEKIAGPRCSDIREFAQVTSIWKFTIHGPAQVIEMPAGAKILALQMQNHEPQLWAAVDPAQPKVGRKFVSLPTGGEFDHTGLHYVGTIQLTSGFVFHVFEDKPGGDPQ